MLNAFLNKIFPQKVIRFMRDLIYILSRLIDLLSDESFREKLEDQEKNLNLTIGKKRTIMKELVGTAILKYHKSF